MHVITKKKPRPDQDMAILRAAGPRAAASPTCLNRVRYGWDAAFGKLNIRST